MITIEINSNIKDIKDVKLPIKGIIQIIKEDVQSELDGSKALTNEYGGNVVDPKPLNKKYEAWKRKHLGYTNIYHGKTLKLINSVKSRSTLTEGEVFTNLSYAKYVNKTRNFFGISKEALEKIEKLLLNTEIG